MNRYVIAFMTVLTAAGCSSSDSKKPTKQATTGTTSGNSQNSTASAKTEFRIFPETVYSGFGGTGRTFKAPVLALNGSGSVTWKVEDPSIAVIDSQQGSNATFKMLKAGQTKLTATSGGKSVSVDLIVNAYAQADIDAGQARYMTDYDATNKACNSCHAQGVGIDHTPTELDADNDDDIIVTFTTGVDPEGRPVNNGQHKWAMTEPQKKGLIAYMRSLEPTGYPEPDHGLDE